MQYPIAGGNDGARPARRASGGADVDRPDKLRVISLILLAYMTAADQGVTPMS